MVVVQPSLARTKPHRDGKQDSKQHARTARDKQYLETKSVEFSATPASGGLVIRSGPRHPVPTGPDFGLGKGRVGAPPLRNPGACRRRRRRSASRRSISSRHKHPIGSSSHKYLRIFFLSLRTIETLPARFFKKKIEKKRKKEENKEVV